MDQFCEDYYPVSPYTYCLNNPVNATDPDGRSIDWYQDKDKTYQYSPNGHSQKDLANGQHYIGKTFTRGNGNHLVQYRSDGSILYNNETDAYKRMWSQADVHYRQMGEKGGREVGGFILTSGKVLVLPDYKNDINTSEISGYGYAIEHGILRKGTESFSISGQIHTHQSKSFNATPSIDVQGDAGISYKMGGLPIFSIGYDNFIHGIYYDFGNLGQHPMEFNITRTQLLTGKFSFASWLNQNRNSFLQKR